MLVTSGREERCSAHTCIFIPVAHWEKKATLFHIIFIFIMLLPHDFPLLFSNYCIALGLPKFPCCNKVLRRTRVQGLLHSQATKVSLTFLLVPGAPGSVACRWSMWPLTRAHRLPYELSSCLCLVAGSHGAQFPWGTEKRLLLAMLQ